MQYMIVSWQELIRIFPSYAIYFKGGKQQKAPQALALRGFLLFQWSDTIIQKVDGSQYSGYLHLAKVDHL